MSKEEGLEFKQKNDLLYFQESSAKSGVNVDTMFIDAAKFIYLRYKDQLHRMMDEETSSQGSGNTTPGLYTGHPSQVKAQQLRNKLRDSQQRNNHKSGCPKC